MNKRTLYFALILLYLLHNDLWYWLDSGLILGIPIGLIYHVAYCVAAGCLMILFVKHAWPDDLEVEERKGTTS